MTISTHEVRSLLRGGGNVVSTDGDTIGSIGQVYLDDQTSEPEWVTTKTGLFGTAESFVPLQGATVSGEDVVVPGAGGRALPLLRPAVRRLRRHGDHSLRSSHPWS